MGHAVTRPVQDPLAVDLLNNRLYIFLIGPPVLGTTEEEKITFPCHIKVVIF